MNKPLHGLQGPIRALFTDLDGTMATDGRLEAETISALYQLHAAGIAVVLVTGRPAGWGQVLGSLFPFAAVVTENGGVSFIPHGQGFRKLYGVALESLPDWRRRMMASADEAFGIIPKARMSADSVYREVDLAIDWNEDVKIPSEDADQIVSVLQRGGFAASRSSVHVNFGPPGIDKFVACKKILQQVFDAELNELSSFVYIGDSLNDAPMFGGLSKSVGVANVIDRWDELPHKPAYITDANEGAGFRELVAHLLSVSR